ncbi:MAG: glycerol-3-phosphate dehydrogenase/oxidase [Planctomycetes bacterium]|nr:glycerol-3-phosphate dehydrogenase/oxidase [Planctomycetota bacterium]
MASAPPAQVLILGAGINGAALARELVLQGVHVCVVDRADISSGATAYASRLIHGGLRYLEYGEFHLVRESLSERNRLLRLAPQFVHPLNFFIPVTNRWGGLVAAARRFLGWPVKSSPPTPRGYWVVRAGLWMYDLLSIGSPMARSAGLDIDHAQMPPVDHELYRWACVYCDAQVCWPERFVVALLEDARRAAASEVLQVFTYSRAELRDGQVSVYFGDRLVKQFRPDAIVNATGAWVDETLNQLQVAHSTLMAGTKGTHLVIDSAPLRESLNAGALYAEAADGRPVFVLPFGRWTLVGTTDIPVADPSVAHTEQSEIDYLLATVNELMPSARVTAEQVLLHYCGVRPLPAVGPKSPSAVTRSHWLERHASATVPTYSVIGGKLTTCRSLAEQAADTLLAQLAIKRQASTRERALPGAEDYPASEALLAQRQKKLAGELGFTVEQVAAVWELVGSRAAEILAQLPRDDRANLSGTNVPRAFAAWTIAHEWVTRLDDLVERRLLLLYDSGLTRATLGGLAELLVAAGRLPADDVERTVNATIARLADTYGRRLDLARRA